MTNYIGRDLDKISNIEILDNITFDGSQSYTLQKGGVNFTPNSAQSIILGIDGITQIGNFSVNGSTIDFGVAVANTSTCNYIIHLGTGLLTAPSDGSVTNAKLGTAPTLEAKGSGSTAGGVRYFCEQSSHHVTLRAGQHSGFSSGSFELKLPTAQGGANTFLKNDGSGNLSFAEAGGGLKHLSTTDFSGSSSNVEVSLDYSAHENFLFVCSLIQGSSSSGGENCDVHFKRDGQSSFDTGSTDYGFAGTYYDINTIFNVNQSDAMEVFRGRSPDRDNMFVAQMTGIGNTTTKSSFKVQFSQTDVPGPGTSAQTLHGVNFSNERIVAMRFSFTAGTVTKIKAKLYGYVH